MASNSDSSFSPRPKRSFKSSLGRSTRSGLLGSTAKVRRLDRLAEEFINEAEGVADAEAETGTRGGRPRDDE